MKDLPFRKNMRLRGYNYSLNGAYFITVCVKDKHELLGSIIVGDDDYIVPSPIEHSKYGNIVMKYIESIDRSYPDITVDKYVIMPNHVHMIIFINDCAETCGTMWASSPTTAKIPSVIRSLKTLVAKECGFSFWQRTYHDHIIRNETEYHKIWKYIDTNPQKWKEDCFYV